MQRREGFTLIEILVTVSIILILMMLAVVNLRSTQMNARNAERLADIENMTRQLDSLYTQGMSYTVAGSPVNLRGSYPTTVHMDDTNAKKEIFKALPDDVIIAPGKTSPDESIFPADDGDEAIGTVAPAPSASQPYVYQPISNTGTLCTDAATQTCRRFNFYYWQEASSGPGTVVMVRSVNR